MAAPKKKKAKVRKAAAREPKKKASRAASRAKRTAPKKAPLKRKKVPPKKRKPVPKKVPPKRKKSAPKKAPPKKRKPAPKKAPPKKRKPAPKKAPPKKRKPAPKKAPPAPKKAPPKRKKPAPKRKKPAPKKAPPKRKKPTPKKELPALALPPKATKELSTIADLAERLKAARGIEREVLLTNLQAAAGEAIGGLRQARAEAVLAPRKVEEWRRNFNKLLPSKLAVSLFQERGRWRQNKNGTITGYAEYEVPLSAGNSPYRWKRWMLGWSEQHLWLDNEPLWFALGLSVSGVKAELYERYVRIKGKVSILSAWTRSRTLCEEQGKVCAGLPPLFYRFQEHVGPLLIHEKGYDIEKLTLFVHYGPVRPRGDIR